MHVPVNNSGLTRVVIAATVNRVFVGSIPTPGANLGLSYNGYYTRLLPGKIRVRIPTVPPNLAIAKAALPQGCRDVGRMP